LAAEFAQRGPDGEMRAMLRALDGIEEADELLTGVLVHAATERRAVEHVAVPPDRDPPRLIRVAWGRMVPEKFIVAVLDTLTR
jgi:hypothetical protein